jgi:hypothetical protein
LTPYFGVWVEDPKEGTFLVHGLESVMRKIFGNVIEKIPTKLADLSAPEVAHPILQISMILLGVTAILGFSPIYLKAGNAFGF